MIRNWIGFNRYLTRVQIQRFIEEMAEFWGTIANYYCGVKLRYTITVLSSSILETHQANILWVKPDCERWCWLQVAHVLWTAYVCFIQIAAQSARQCINVNFLNHNAEGDMKVCGSFFKSLQGWLQSTESHKIKKTASLFEWEQTASEALNHLSFILFRLLEVFIMEGDVSSETVASLIRTLWMNVQTLPAFNSFPSLQILNWLSFGCISGLLMHQSLQGGACCAPGFVLPLKMPIPTPFQFSRHCQPSDISATFYGHREERQL